VSAPVKVYGLHRHCSCCDKQSTRQTTVTCAAHGPMEADAAGDFHCPAEGCPAALPADEWIRLVDGTPADTPEPIALTVTP
jgi:hypothetical protein